MDYYNIAIAINEKYEKYAATMILSLIDNNKGCFEIYILNSFPQEKELSIINDICQNNSNVQIHDIRISPQLYNKFPICRQITKETYYRFLIVDVIPNDIKKVLYLDSDIIINKSIDKLYNTDISDYIFAICEDEYTSINKGTITIFDKKSEKPNLGKYFNAGVMLINLEKYKNKISQKTIEKFVIDNINDIVWNDQDILNYLYGSEVKYVEYSLYNKEVMMIKSRNEEQYFSKNTAIFHYCGKIKPDSYKYTNYCADIFWKYAKNIRSFEKSKRKYDMFNLFWRKMYKIYCKGTSIIKRVINK